jgi:DinB superfamily
MTEQEALTARLRASADALLAMRADVLSGAPWPLAAEFGPGPEAAWGPPEVLAHVTEMLPYWLGEVERILDAAADPAPFGRVATDEVRLAIIGRDRTVPPRELFDRVESDVARYERRLRELRPDELAREGLHPVRGRMTVQQALDRFAIAHLEEHASQLRNLLAAGARPPA